MSIRGARGVPVYRHGLRGVVFLSLQRSATALPVACGRTSAEVERPKSGVEPPLSKWPIALFATQRAPHTKQLRVILFETNAPCAGPEPDLEQRGAAYFVTVNF